MVTVNALCVPGMPSVTLRAEFKAHIIPMSVAVCYHLLLFKINNTTQLQHFFSATDGH